MIVPRRRCEELRRALVSLGLVAGLLGSCAAPRKAPPPRDPSLQQAHQLVREAEALVEDGYAARALDQLTAGFAHATSSEVVFTGSYALGWLCTEVARQDPERRRELRLEAVRHYQKALEVHPGHVASSENLSLVYRSLGRYEEAISVLRAIPFEGSTVGQRIARWIAIGDLYFEQGLFERAEAEYERAYGLDAKSEAAASKLVLVHGRLQEGWAEPLFAYGVHFAEEGLPHVARRAHETLMARAVGDPTLQPLASRSLQRWVMLEAKSGTLSPESLEKLPSCEEWPEPCRCDLEAIVREPLSLSAAGDGAGNHWTETEEERHVLAFAYRALAGRHAGRGEYATAVAVYERGIDLAPELACYGSEGELARKDIASLELALDLALLIQNHPEVDPDGEKLDGLLEEFVAGGVAPELAARPASLERFHTVLGLVYAERGAWVDDNAWRTAEKHLRSARDVARRRGKGGEHDQPLPHLSRILADGLAGIRLLQEAFGAYRDAAQGYFDEENPELAEENYQRADEIARRLAADMGEDLHDLRHLVDVREGGWFPRHWIEPGWYVTAGLGLSNANTSAGELDGTLGSLPPMYMTMSSMDDRDRAVKFGVNYQFDAPFAMELGYVTLGEIESGIRVSGLGDITQFTEDTGEVHPFLAEGIALGLRANLYGTRRFTLSAKAGAWIWDAHVEVEIVDLTNMATSVLELDEDGIDAYYGVGLDTWIAGPLSVRAEYERFRADGQDLDALTLSAVYGL